MIFLPVEPGPHGFLGRVPGLEKVALSEVIAIGSHAPYYGAKGERAAVWLRGNPIDDKHRVLLKLTPEEFKAVLAPKPADTSGPRTRAIEL